MGGRSVEFIAREVNTVQEANKAAEHIFNNVRGNRNFILPVDLLGFLPKADVREAFNMIDHKGIGMATLPDLRSALNEIFTERNSAAAALRHTKIILKDVNRIVLGLLVIVDLFFWVAIMNNDVAAVWLSFSSVFALVAWTLGASLREIFDAIVFIFYVHPFNVGDTVQIAGEVSKELGGFGDWLVVEELGLVTSRFRRWDGRSLITSTSLLAKKTIDNLSRSHTLQKTVLLTVDAGMNSTDISELETAVRTLLVSDPNEFMPGDFQVDVAHFRIPLKTEIQVRYRLAHGGENPDRMARAHSRVVLCVASVVVDVLKCGYTDTIGMMRCGALDRYNKMAESAVGSETYQSRVNTASARLPLRNSVIRFHEAFPPGATTW
eukprot:CAMPEP_0198197762 /NCGR_PEP_ID=MMETSP1445-20131203/1319_1 /TAXON_ID=36898 /ORGANISM="Pyramimonas sp., Strain CCMP2087" /LENGTH=378 /DNA_ID=CAMNT_0043867131 /DNA_START=75 /DNA_END=1211 /DNA_ORIENTATION=-